TERKPLLYYKVQVQVSSSNLTPGSFKFSDFELDT
ncbi:MAG: hypothetical protein ACI8P3_003647, partial [Saprospiraceae bacterium]